MTVSPKLVDIGINKSQSSRWQQIAKLVDRKKRATFVLTCSLWRSVWCYNACRGGYIPAHVFWGGNCNVTGAVVSDNDTIQTGDILTLAFGGIEDGNLLLVRFKDGEYRLEGVVEARYRDLRNEDGDPKQANDTGLLKPASKL